MDQFQCCKCNMLHNGSVVFVFENSLSGSRPLSALIASRSTLDSAPAAAAAAGLAVVRFLTDFITVFFAADPVCYKH